MKDEINKKAIDTTIERMFSKIKNRENIKEELYYLNEVYNYIIENYPDRVIEFAYLKKAIVKANLYNTQYLSMKEWRAAHNHLKKVRIEKKEKYKALWMEKSLIYRFIHRNSSPSKINKSDDINQINEYIERLKK